MTPSWSSAPHTSILNITTLSIYFHNHSPSPPNLWVFSLLIPWSQSATKTHWLDHVCFLLPVPSAQALFYPRMFLHSPFPSVGQTNKFLKSRNQFPVPPQDLPWLTNLQMLSCYLSTWCTTNDMQYHMSIFDCSSFLSNSKNYAPFNIISRCF